MIHKSPSIISCLPPASCLTVDRSVHSSLILQSLICKMGRTHRGEGCWMESDCSMTLDRLLPLVPGASNHPTLPRNEESAGLSAGKQGPAGHSFCTSISSSVTERDYNRNTLQGLSLGLINSNMWKVCEKFLEHCLAHGEHSLHVGCSQDCLLSSMYYFTISLSPLFYLIAKILNMSFLILNPMCCENLCFTYTTDTTNDAFKMLL